MWASFTIFSGGAMQIATEAAERAHAWVRESSESIARMGQRLVAEIRLTIDLPRWRQARTPAEHLAALSWPRVAALAIVPVSLIAGLYIFHLLTRPDAYPPPDPTAREIAARAEALRHASDGPPPSLVEANKSWKAQ